MKYSITVFGLGFVGLTTALAFAEKDNIVYGVDVNLERCNLIKSGRVPFVEPGLDNALTKHLNSNFLVTSNYEEAVKNSNFIFLCVGTPSGKNGEADLKYIYSVIDMISPTLNDDKHRVVVIKSTVPPSTTSEKIIPYIEQKGISVGDRVSIANNPEFLREGHCWEDMINADRIVCGICNKKSGEMLEDLYCDFGTKFFTVSLNTGEFIKYLSNTLLATMISYSNEMSKVADVIGEIQIKEAFDILHLDRRWSSCNMSSYVYPGCGYGGYCLPKDTQAMYEKSKTKGYEPLILRDVIEINNSMPKYMANKIMNIVNENDKIGILGLSFKPESDDVRDSSSAKIIKILLENRYNNIFAYDPIANDVFHREYKLDNIRYCENLKKICEVSDVLVIVTAWNEFKDVKKLFPEKMIIDCRYFLK